MEYNLDFIEDGQRHLIHELIQNIDISRLFPAAIEIHKRVTLNCFFDYTVKRSNVTSRPAEKGKP